jgi:hypothetical protein
MGLNFLAVFPHQCEECGVCALNKKSSVTAPPFFSFRFAVELVN